MASPAADALRQPISPPPPVYLRSSPPPPPSEGPPPLPFQEQPSERPTKANLPQITRKPLPGVPLDGEGNAYIQNSPLSPVRIDDPSSIPQASSAQIEDTRSPAPRVPSGSFQSRELPPRRDSLIDPKPSQPQYLPYRHRNSQSISGSLSGINGRRSSSKAERSNNTPDQGFRFSSEQVPAASSSGSMDSEPQPSETYQPLQYHHQQLKDNIVQHNSHRGSRATIISTSDSSSGPGAEHLIGPNHHLAPARANYSALQLPRPNSAYSSVSDLGVRGRARSPQLSPNVHARAPSTHSNISPDNRPMSFVDLLNVPYPQPAPAPVNLSNDHLRTSVGNNASLLSHKQTFDMYLANVKKTNDSSVQYEFAVFMINAAKERNISEANEESENNSNISNAELLRESRSILQRLADRSYPYAQYYLGDGYASGLFNKGKEDHDKAFTLFVAASKHGHAEAGYRAALCYEFGWGSRIDGAKAVQFYRQAASKNHPGAMSRLGRACLSGEMGQVKRYREGIKWLKRAAESADVQYNSAPYELGLLHETGYGEDIFQDESYACQLFTKSAELGHSEASYRLGDAYEHGTLNCPRDTALSVHFYTGAAQAGHLHSMMALCAWFMVGADPVLERDETEAYEWAKKAAVEGLPKAQYAVGYFTETGIGCRCDPLESNVWYVKAADQGDERAKQRIAAIRDAASGADSHSSGKKSKASKSSKKSKASKLQPGEPSSDTSKGNKRFVIF